MEKKGKRKTIDYSFGERVKNAGKAVAAENKNKRRILSHREVECITNDDDFPLPSDEQGKAFLVGLVGRRKSGKTYFLDQLIKTVWRGEFDIIYVLSKTAQHQDIFKTWKGKIRFIESWDPDFFDKLSEQQKEHPKRKVLIIIDDMSAHMRERLYATNIDEFAFTGRHFRVSVVWLAQKITLFTPGFRQECDGFFLFREENMQELRMLHREWGFGEIDDFLVLLLENTVEKYSWLMLRNVGGTVKIFRLPTPEEFAKIRNQDFLKNSKGGDEEAPKKSRGSTTRTSSERSK